MARPLLPDDLWTEIAPLLPPPRPRPKGGRRPIENRAALTGILFVLRSGVPWEMLPAEMGCGCGMSCWRRLRDWQAAGVWARLHQVLLERLHGAGEIDWSRASLDSASVPAKKGALPPARTRRTGARRAQSATWSPTRGTPLGFRLSGANRHDSVMMAPTLDAIPPVRNGRRGRPRHRPDKLHADKAYDAQPRRHECRARGIVPRIARRGIDSSERLGRHRWVVERTHAWFNRFRRLPVRYERRADIYEAFTSLAASLITLNQIRRFC
uniref:IS5 family transposase n=1 Tax=Methylobacterium sp. B34 TaxID=95563 RepID=UPI001FCCAD18|nr:IS5 family transposase [Methylobacterium sp. B34]